MSESVNTYANMSIQEMMDVNLSIQDNSNDIVRALDKGDQMIDELNHQTSKIEQEIIDKSRTWSDANSKMVKDLEEKRHSNETKWAMIENKMQQLNDLWRHKQRRTDLSITQTTLNVNRNESEQQSKQITYLYDIVYQIFHNYLTRD